jgi:hypothetical protein
MGHTELITRDRDSKCLMSDTDPFLNDIEG